MTAKEILTAQKNVGKKLLTAIAMLLISAIMLCGVSYAWISLSVAPEAGRIDTTVGANGFLEIALQSYNGADGALGERAAIGSGRGKSSAAAGITESNKTWGNIVDLNTDAYGLNDISLVPTRLNVETSNNDWVNRGNMLLVPAFGKDGRMTGLDPVGYCYYDEEEDSYIQSTTYGARIIGRENELNVADRRVRVNQYDRLSIVTQMANKVNTDREKLKSDLRAVFNFKGDYLGESVDNAHDILTMLYYGVANRGNFGEMTDSTWAAVDRIVDQVSGIVGEAAVSMRYALMARAASDMVSFPDGDDDANDALAAIFQNYQDYSLTDISNLAETYGWTDITDAVSAIQGCYTRADNAKGFLYDNGGNPITNKIANAVLQLINPASFNLGFAEMDCLNANDLEEYLSSTIFDDCYDENYPEMVFMGGNKGNASSGLFADMAAVVGDYSAEMFDPEYLEFDSVTVYVYATTKTARAEYSETNNPGGLGEVLKTAQRATVSGDIKITTTLDINVTAYGYAIDLAFRTNENSTLQLLGTAADRVTGETGAEGATAGAGSRMTFKYAGSMSSDQIDALMSCVYVVFLDTDTGLVLGGASAGTPQIDSNTLTVTAPLIMKRVYISSSGILSLGQKTDDQKIKNLVENVPSYITAVIYLNGDETSSSMLPYDSYVSLEGSINLQFNSSAHLSPAKN